MLNSPIAVSARLLLVAGAFSLFYGPADQFFGTVLAQTALPEDVERVLALEAQGILVDRRQSITSTSPASRWHSGILIVQNQPVECESLDVSAGEQAYLDRREDVQSDLQHFDLATWCAEHGFVEQYRAHLNFILKDQPDNLVLRNLLRHQFLDGRWFTPYEIALAREQAERMSRALVRWLPSVEAVLKQLTLKNSQSTQRAVKKLAQMDEADLVFALEVAIPQASPDAALLLTRKISEFCTPEACSALVRIAIAEHALPETRQLAKTLIQEGFNRDVYVPELLGMLVDVPDARSSITTLPNGDLVLNRLVMRELQDKRELYRFRKYIARGESIDFLVTQHGPQTLGRSAHRRWARNHPADPNLVRQASIQQEWLARKWMQRVRNYIRAEFLSEFFSDSPAVHDLSADIAADDLALAKSLTEEQAILDSQLESIRRKAGSQNRRIMTFLLETQDVNPGETPADWWRWWNELNDRYTKRKPIQEFRGMQYEQNEAIEAGIVTRRNGGSCLAGETPIQTSRGLIPLKEIRVGDLAVSQNVDSGELQLKPVFDVVARPPTTLYTVKLGDKEIQATSGHMWWVSGVGWRRTRELERDMLLHTIRGNIRITDISENLVQVETYNLVVADFHTYFAGDARMLCNDNAYTNASTRSVPGFGNFAVAP